MSLEKGFDIHQESLKLHDNEVPYFIPNALDLDRLGEDGIDLKLDGMHLRKKEKEQRRKNNSNGHFFLSCVELVDSLSDNSAAILNNEETFDALRSFIL